MRRIIFLFILPFLFFSLFFFPKTFSFAETGYLETQFGICGGFSTACLNPKFTGIWTVAIPPTKEEESLKTHMPFLTKKRPTLVKIRLCFIDEILGGTFQYKQKGSHKKYRNFGLAEKTALSENEFKANIAGSIKDFPSTVTSEQLEAILVVVYFTTKLLNDDELQLTLDDGYIINLKRSNELITNTDTQCIIGN